MIDHSELMLSIRRFSARLRESQIAFLRRESARYGLSENEALRRALDSVMTSSSVLKGKSWSPDEVALRDRLANDHGLVLSKIDHDKFAIRCGGEVIKLIVEKPLHSKK